MGTYALTGGASGIGAALLNSLSEQGHSVINVDIKDADIIADLSTVDGRQQAIAGITERAPDGLDGFVPVAGLAAASAPPHLITSVNYFGTVELVEGLRPLLEKKGGGIVLLSSNSAPMQVGGEELIDTLLSGDEQASLEVTARIAEGTHYMLTKRAVTFWMQQIGRAHV